MILPPRQDRQSGQLLARERPAARLSYGMDDWSYGMDGPSVQSRERRSRLTRSCLRHTLG